MAWPTLDDVKNQLGIPLSETSHDEALTQALQASIDQVTRDTGHVDRETGAIEALAAEDVTSSLNRAALLLTVQVVKAPDAPYGVAAVFDTGGLYVASQHPGYLRLLVGSRRDFPIA